MNYIDIVNNIRELEKGFKLNLDENDVNKLLSIFDDHGCYYLSKMLKGKRSDSMDAENYIYKYYEFSVDLFKKLSKYNISYAVLKGVPLSLAAYNDVSLRKSTDIDILVSQSDVKQVKSILNELGFKQGEVIDGKFVPISRKQELFYIANSHQIAPFFLETKEKKMPFIEVDINKQVMWGESSVKLDVNEFLANTKSCKLSNELVFCTLDPVHFFISLCLHHYKDMNSYYLLFVKNRISLRMFCDIYYYLKNNYNICDLDSLLYYSEKYNVKEYIYFCLYYCDKIFDDDLIKNYLGRFKTSKGTELIECYGLNEKEQKKWSISFLERIFNKNLSEYLTRNLSEKNMQKINYNIENLL